MKIIYAGSDSLMIIEDPGKIGSIRTSCFLHGGLRQHIEVETVFSCLCLVAVCACRLNFSSGAPSPGGLAGSSMPGIIKKSDYFYSAS